MARIIAFIDVVAVHGPVPALVLVLVWELVPVVVLGGVGAHVLVIVLVAVLGPVHPVPEVVLTKSFLVITKYFIICEINRELK